MLRASLPRLSGELPGNITVNPVVRKFHRPVLKPHAGKRFEARTAKGQPTKFSILASSFTDMREVQIPKTPQIEAVVRGHRHLHEHHHKTHSALVINSIASANIAAKAASEDAVRNRDYGPRPSKYTQPPQSVEDIGECNNAADVYIAEHLMLKKDDMRNGPTPIKFPWMK